MTRGGGGQKIRNFHGHHWWKPPNPFLTQFPAKSHHLYKTHMEHNWEAEEYRIWWHVALVGTVFVQHCMQQARPGLIRWICNYKLKTAINGLCLRQRPRPQKVETPFEFWSSRRRKNYRHMDEEMQFCWVRRCTEMFEAEEAVSQWHAMATPSVHLSAQRFADSHAST